MVPTILLDIYCSASNAKLNIEKTEVVSLLKSPAVDWRRLCQQKGMRWHDSSTDEVPVYLGYPLYCSRRQWIRYFDLLLDKIDRHLKILSQRHLSPTGKWNWTRPVVPNQLFFVAKVFLNLFVSLSVSPMLLQHYNV